MIKKSQNSVFVPPSSQNDNCAGDEQKMAKHRFFHHHGGSKGYEFAGRVVCPRLTPDDLQVIRVDLTCWGID